jgi:thiol-disulfide isomerase/thioredoxin
MKKFFSFFLLTLMTACASLQTSDSPMNISLPKENPASLPDLGPAPELTTTTWLNVESPLRLADLRGKVVALEMWTFGCYNCQNVMPYLKAWHDAYANQGLVMIGNHYPEFSFEEDLTNLKNAVSEYGIEYPVTQDNDGITWDAYKNRYWPTLYLIDKNGHIRYIHIGEGAYKETEANIQALLAEVY